MIMEYPPPRGYKGNTLYPNVDYNLMAPMASLVRKKRFFLTFSLSVKQNLQVSLL
jgi:hypothetical protein